MRKVVWTVVALAFSVTTAWAQNSASDTLRSSWSNVKRNIRESAEQMPEADYGFKPTPEVRTFGQILAHVAGASYVYCSAAKGEKTPFTEDAFEKTATTKAAIVKVTQEALDYCDGAFLALNDGNAPGFKALIGQIAHDNEHYGNLVTYFRLKGMVPPSSKR
jgi:hypothetical protein